MNGKALSLMSILSILASASIIESIGPVNQELLPNSSVWSKIGGTSTFREILTDGVGVVKILPPGDITISDEELYLKELRTIMMKYNGLCLDSADDDTYISCLENYTDEKEKASLYELYSKISGSISGNVAVSPYDGRSVFLFYEDFNGNDLPSGWQINNGGDYFKIENGMAHFDAASFGSTVSISSPQDLDLRFPTALSYGGTIEAGIEAENYDEWIGFHLSFDNDPGTETHYMKNGYSFGFWGWNGGAHETRTWVNSSKYADDYGAYDNFYRAENGVGYFVGGSYFNGNLKHFFPVSTPFGNVHDIDNQRSDDVYKNQPVKRITISVWQGAYWKVDWVRIRNSAEETITEGSGYTQVDVLTPTKNFQVKVFLPSIPQTNILVVVDNDLNSDNGYIKELSYCFEQPNGECSFQGSDKLWANIDVDMNTGDTLFVYSIPSS